MKILSTFAFVTLLFTGCTRNSIDEGAAAFVIYEPTTGDIRTLNEDVKPYVKLYTDFTVISYTRTDDKKNSKHLVHIIPTSKLGVVRWLDPNKK